MDNLTDGHNLSAMTITFIHMFAFRERLCDTHKELKQQVVVWILILKADRALFLQMNSIDERDCTLIPVGLQIISLRHPR